MELFFFFFQNFLKNSTNIEIVIFGFLIKELLESTITISMEHINTLYISQIYQ